MVAIAGIAVALIADAVAVVVVVVASVVVVCCCSSCCGQPDEVDVVFYLVCC